MTSRKITKQTFMTVVETDKHNPTPGYREDPIYTVIQTFNVMHRHKRGSNRPAGYFHAGWSSRDAAVEVRWLWTTEHDYFAPEITFRPTESGISLARKIGKTLRGVLRTDNETPDALSEALGATIVEYCGDNYQKEGCWDDYRPIRVPGECAMETLARAAL